jgi:hypothetical protein
MRLLMVHFTRAEGRPYIQISVYWELLYGAVKHPGHKNNAERKWGEVTSHVEEGVLQHFIPALWIGITSTLHSSWHIGSAVWRINPMGTNSSPTQQSLTSNLQPLLSGSNLTLNATFWKMQHCLLGHWPSCTCLEADQQHSCLFLACNLHL